MNTHSLCAAAAEFEKVIDASDHICKKGNSETRILCLFYAMWAALELRESLQSCGWTRPPTNKSMPRESFAPRISMPRVDAVRAAVSTFMNLVTSNGIFGIDDLLENMGLFTLCPMPEQQLLRMALVVADLAEQVRPVPLVDLSFLAIRLSDFPRAARFAMEARSLNPRSWELYNLCLLDGLIALNAGNRRKAVQCLDMSMAACLSDEYSLLSCGARVPNLSLAEEVLRNGGRIEVVRHLLQCKNVWQVLSSHIDEWVTTIERGETPDFRGVGISKGTMNLSYMLKTQWLRICSLIGKEEPNSTVPRSVAGALAGRERLRAKFKHNAHGNREIENL